MPSLMHAVSASSIGPPMMKKMSLTPCAFRQRARISLPVSSAISVSPLSVIVGSDHPFLVQCVDIAGAHAEPVAEHLRVVLPEQWGRVEFRRLSVEANRPGRHLERAGRVLRCLQDAALGKARLVHQ